MCTLISSSKCLVNKHVIWKFVVNEASSRMSHQRSTLGFLLFGILYIFLLLEAVNDTISSSKQVLTFRQYLVKIVVGLLATAAKGVHPPNFYTSFLGSSLFEYLAYPYSLSVCWDNKTYG